VALNLFSQYIILKMSDQNKIFVDLLKKYTLIDKDFIDTFFTKFRIGGELSFHLKDKNVATYLGI